MVDGTTAGTDTDPANPWLRPLPLAALLTPIIAAPSGRGLVPLLIILSGWALWEAIRKRQIGHLCRQSTLVWVSAAAALSLASTLWAARPDDAIGATLGFATLGAAGISLFSVSASLSQVERRVTGHALIAGVFIASALLLVGAFYGTITGAPLWGHPDQHPLRTLSHAQTVLAALFVPATARLFGTASRYRWPAVCSLASGLAIAFWLLDHTASVVSVGIGAVTYFCVRAAGARTAVIVGGAISLMVLITPFVLDQWLPPFEKLMTATADGNGAWPLEFHRKFMWRFALAHTEAAFWFGHGADAARSFPGASQKIMWGIELMPLHPHNGALQVYLELGIVGAALASVLPLWIGARLARENAEAAAIGSAIMAAYMVPWMLSYGIWQSWWVALAWLLAAVARAFCRE